MPFFHRPPHDRGPLRPRLPAPSPGNPPSQGGDRPCAGSTSPSLSTSASHVPASLCAPVSPVPPSANTLSRAPSDALTETELRAAAQVGYAVIDLETTGLSPVSDTILEVAVVLTDPSGCTQTSWSTLINPGRGTDVGPTHIHGLIAQDLLDAPSLDEVADRLARDLAGRAVVAHNARFDVGFLTQALGRRRLLDPGAPIPRVCTMEWSRHFMATPSRRLTTCCEVAGVEIGRHHSALDDARAAAGLLRHYMSVGRARGEEPVAWTRSLVDAWRFTGWHWDDERAQGADERLVTRQRPGALR
ncbi:3'-5' exonuclease [Actinomyces lilanjuaniae]|uniref:3'-5' exonuclease n=1 Tax=Actinomyces lilanjuaniae TaxID=2321394 RepID=A0ABM6Z1C7_9ACTO|nr:3'-5' exonuclease [Actinomyces lilanjuaniae]AYD89068.1 3'-5' exonuclease [Actinomyces lilanjuaniae]